MHTFDIKETYKTKKEGANARGIDYNFSLEQFKVFWGLRDKVPCFYTNNILIPDAPYSKEIDCYYPTIERLVESDPYSPENCVWCSAKSNRVKGHYIEQGLDCSGKGQDIISLVAKIKKTLANPKQIESKLAIYKEAYLKLNKEVTSEEDVVPPRQEVTVSPDVYLAKSYHSLGELVMTVADFELSFAQYKAKMKKVKCELTGNKFTQDEVKSLHWLDKTKPLSKDNTLVTTKVISESLDVFMTNTKLSLNELKKLCKVITNK